MSTIATQKKMWAYSLGEPYKFSPVALDTPTEDDVAEGEVLLKVLVGGICGSDLPYFKGLVPPYGTPAPDGRGLVAPPGAPLHEVVGEVVFSRDPALQPGVLVVGWATRMNGIAEYVVVGGADLHAFSPSLAPEIAIMLQPLACVIHAVDQLQDVAGSHAAVIGQGSIGVLFSHVLKQAGAAHVTGVDVVDRSDLQATFGVDGTVTATSHRWASSLLTEEERPEIIVEAVGHQVGTLTDAVHALRAGGQIYYFGIPDDAVYPFPMGVFLRKHGRLITGYTPLAARRGVLERAEQHLAAHPELATPYLSHRFKFSEVEQAFNAAIRPGPGQLKVTLELD